MKELCGRCGHGMHDNPCQHVVKRMVSSRLATSLNFPAPAIPTDVPCDCPLGIRSDVLACRLLDQLLQSSRAAIELQMFIHDIEVDDETGLPRRKRIDALPIETKEAK